MLRGKQQPHDYLPTLKSEIIDAGLLPNKRTHALLAEYSLQPGKVKEVRRRTLTNALGGRSSAALVRWCTVMSCQARSEEAVGSGCKAWDSLRLCLRGAVALKNRMTCKLCTWPFLRGICSNKGFVREMCTGALLQPTCFAYVFSP